MIEATAPLQVIIEKTPYFNYSFCLNNFSFLRKIIISDVINDFNQIKIEISSEIGLFSPYTIHLDSFTKGLSRTVQNFDFKYKLTLIRNFTEKELDTITVKIYSDEEVLCLEDFKLSVLPIDYFGGFGAYPELLASYSLPNHPLIYSIKTEAIKILEKSNLKPAFEGYQLKDKDRVLQMVASIYQAILNLQIVYSAMPPSFETHGQRIRLIDKILETKFGNCIDISLLFAACLEAIDLNPIILITNGHAFVGVWLEDNRFEKMVNFDQTAISKRIAFGIKEIGLIESTHLCNGSALSLKEAMNIAETQVLNANNFVLSIDIKNARSRGILPLPLTNKEESVTVDGKLNNIVSDQKISSNFDVKEIYHDLELSDTKNLTKQKVWERKLLDLSLRNNLLNIRFTKSMLQLVDLKINLLEDKLADGKSYTIHPSNNQQALRRYNLYLEPLHSSEPLFKLAEEEFRYNRLLSLYHQDDLNTILIHLYRNSKLAEEENGKSTLYLGVGLLKWFEPKNKLQPRFAPILLIPVELSRKSVNSKFTLRSREEETMINITLLEYLKQEYQFNLNALEELPMDDYGVDVQKVLAIFRKAILNLEGWDVLEQTVLGNFSFNKLILWQDISKFSEEIKKSSIVKSLIDGKLCESLDIITPNESLEHLPSSQLTLPIATDNSQLDAIRNSNENKSFILHGPPGTGKSQTITNIIANALANNKKVLFVAAKKAALDVVHNRLEKIGLGPFCLELHSNKSKKSDVLNQLQHTLEVPKYQSNIDFHVEAARIDQRKIELSRFVDLLHQPFAIGWSLYDSVSFLDVNGVEIREEWILPLKLEELDRSIWNNWKDWAVPFGGLIQKLPSISKHPLRWINLKEQNFSNRNIIENSIDRYIDAEISIDRIDTDLKLNLPKNWIENKIPLFKFLKQLANFSVNNSILNLYFDEYHRNLLYNWLQFQSKKQSLEQSILQKFNNRIFGASNYEIESTWNHSKHTWFLPKWFFQRKVKHFLNGFSKNKIVAEQEVDQIFSQLNDFDSVSKNLNDQKFQFINKTANAYLLGNGFDLEAIHNDLEQTKQIVELAQDLYFDSFEIWLKEFNSNSAYKDLIPFSLKTLNDYESVRESLLVFLSNIPSTEDLIHLKNNLDQLEDWIRFNYYKDQAEELELLWLIQLLELEVVDKNSIRLEMESVLHLNYFIQSLDQSAILNGFDADVYEAQIIQYKKLHQEFIELTKSQLLLDLSNKIPNLAQEAIQSSEIGILQRGIRNKGRGISIRRLFDMIPTLLPRLKPCMLMSPISVAQYFDVSTDHFDIVIFDEASQLPTSEAISALARAKQAIIVGDPKQMPPTSFFASNKIDEDNMELEDLESILDDTLALSIPSKYLLRHYRSKHESLISFSNSNFYDNKLLTFPSHDDLDKKVSFEFVKGFYDKGKTRTNKIEAEAIILYIENHLEFRSNRSLGVVTFSQTQQNLIEDLLQKLFSDKPHLEEKSLEGEEPIFVKNLENVQGDERDFILFSIGYGPDEEGKISMNFGPLNRDGGWRRLNVAVTRARYEMKIFSSLKADQIDLNRTKSEGVKGFKAFLNFAEKSQFNSADSIAKVPDQYSLIESIALYLNDMGLEVKTDIGTSDYRVDIGIVHPNNKHQYILGILVDGKNYFNTQTTNDRELLIPSVLQSLGWNIYRIWALDWMKNKSKIFAKISEQIQSILSQPENVETNDSNIFQTPVNKSISVVLEEDSGYKKMISYEVADASPILLANSESIYYPENRFNLKMQMHEIIKIESPISQNYLFRKILKLWNTTRAGNKLNTYLSEIANELPGVETVVSHQPFYWNRDQYLNGLDNFRDNEIEKRNIEDIAPEELELAILEIMENNLSVVSENLVRATAKIFGFSKVGSIIDESIKTSITNLVARNSLKSVDGRIVFVE
ncbi:DUF3320 domain-containing protein [Peijinzhouia sedimentorum]